MPKINDAKGGVLLMVLVMTVVITSLLTLLLSQSNDLILFSSAVKNNTKVYAAKRSMQALAQSVIDTQKIRKTKLLSLNRLPFANITGKLTLAKAKNKSKTHYYLTTEIKKLKRVFVFKSKLSKSKRKVEK